MPLLRGKAVFNLFFENSTRTRTTFEIAAKRLSADVINLNIDVSSHDQGRDRCSTPSPTSSAMHADMFVVRHAQSGAPYLIARHVKPHESRDQRRRRPPRASRRRACSTCSPSATTRRISRSLTVAIVGDVLHSRVARSLIHGLTTLGVPEVRVIGPQTLLPAGVEALGVRVFHDMREGLQGLRRGGDAAPAERAHAAARCCLRRRSSSSTTA